MKTAQVYRSWLIAAIGGWALAGWAQAGEMQPTSRALIELDRAPGWNLGAQLRAGRRRLEVEEDRLALDIRQFTVRIGVRPLPILHTWGELGAGQAERRGRDLGPVENGGHGEWRYAEDDKGSAGLVWGVGAGLAMFEYVLRSSPVFGNQESLALDVLTTYRVSESDLPPLRRFRFDSVAADFVSDPVAGDTGEDLTLRWKDTRLAALFTYRLNRYGEVTWRGYEPTGYAIWGGPLYTRTTGSYGNQSISETHDFGVWLGFDVRFPSNWLAQVSLQWMNDDDREVLLSVNRYF